MTKAKPSISFRGPGEGDGQGGSSQDGPTQIGKWTFTPRPSGCSGTGNATLEHESLAVDLSYSSSVFEDFLHTMSMIQIDFDRRSGNIDRFTMPGDRRAGGSSCV
ncbi:hypothetical protein ADK61_06430 [Streptomyces sp. XY66]|nr:hypothetical protein ADK61_06430 [Streptomyces sp. XY66]